MSKLVDLTATRFGKLTVVEKITGKFHKIYWLCRCDCGFDTIVTSRHLQAPKGRRTISCGCVRETAGSNFKHGDCYTRLYRIWQGMRDRCYRPSSGSYSNYGARGIKVEFEPWRTDYLIFRSWALANGYSDKLSLDRIDVNKGYFPENCRWATSIKQANNKRTSLLLTAFGETQSIAEWARDPRAKVSKHSMYQRKRAGWKDLHIITTPSQYDELVA